MSENERVEPIRVQLRNWPAEGDVGGWVVPYGEILSNWTVIAVHARYLSPRVPGSDTRRFDQTAMLVDLAGGWKLEARERVLVYNDRHMGWYLREVDEDYLAKIEEFRLTGDA